MNLYQTKVDISSFFRIVVLSEDIANGSLSVTM